MSIYKLNPGLINTTTATDGDVLTFVSANAKVEFKAASSGGGGVTTGKAIAMAMIFGG